MSDQNPYSTPDASLSVAGSDETYEPSLFSFSGRLGRLRYLGYLMIVQFIVGIAMAILMSIVGAFGAGAGEPGTLVFVLLGLFYLVIIVASVAFGKRRLNDLDKSGFWLFLLIVPLANAALAIYMMFFPGTDGNNSYGPAPMPNSAGIKILAGILALFFVGGIVAAIMIPAMMGAGLGNP